MIPRDLAEPLDQGQDGPSRDVLDGREPDRAADGPTESENAPDGMAAGALAGRFFNVRTFVSFALGFAILLFLLTHVQVDVAEIGERVAQANFAWLVPAAIAFYATFPVRALRWRRLLRNAGPTDRDRLPRLLGLSEIFLLSWFANCVVPAKLGDAYRAYLLKVNAGVSFSRTVGTILAERIIDILLVFALMAISASLSFGRALPAEIVLLMQVGLVVAAVVVGGLVFLPNLRPVVERMLPTRLHGQYHSFEQGTLRSFRHLPYVLLLSLLAWGGEIARLYFVTLALGVPSLAPSVVVFVALASALATTLPFTPAGLGLAEGAIVAILLLAANAGLAPDLDQHTAASIALLDRGISYGSLVVVGLFVYTISKRK